MSYNCHRIQLPRGLTVENGVDFRFFCTLKPRDSLMQGIKIYYRVEPAAGVLVINSVHVECQRLANSCRATISW